MLNTYIVDGDKGGVGKSFFARTLVDYAIHQSNVVYIIDCDPTSPDVVSAGSYSSGVVGAADVFAANLPIRSDDSIYAMVDGVQSILEGRDQSKTSRMVINLPAGVGVSINEASASALEALGAVPVWVMSTDQSSLDQFEKRLDLPLYCNGGIVVLNLRHGGREMFKRYDQSAARKKALGNGWREIEFPVLNQYIVSKVGITPWHKVNKDEHGLGSHAGIETFRKVVARRFKEVLKF